MTLKCGDDFLMISCFNTKPACGQTGGKKLLYQLTNNKNQKVQIVINSSNLSSKAVTGTNNAGRCRKNWLFLHRHKLQYNTTLQ